MQRGSLTVNGVRLSYLRWGDSGPPVLFVHGNSHCGGVWAPIASALADAGLTAFALDMRGHGHSEKPDAGYDWGSLRDDVIGVLAALDQSDVLLVGHSRGGGAALLAAAAAPERVAGVVVYEPTIPSLAAALSPEVTARLVDRALHRRSVFPSRDDLIERYRERDTFRLWDDGVLRAYAEHGAVERPGGDVELRCPPWVEAQLYEAMADTRAWEGMHAPDVRLLAIFGERGGRVGEGRDPGAALRGMFPRTETRVMPGATHLGPMEQPAAFAEIVREFIGRLD